MVNLGVSLLFLLLERILSFDYIELVSLQVQFFLFTRIADVGACLSFLLEKSSDAAGRFFYTSDTLLFK
jgi:hypothetical protein